MLGLTAFLLVHIAVPYDLRKDSTPVKGQPYERYFTHDKFGREITFYVTGSKGPDKPLAVYVQGSGYGSNFVEMNGRIVPQNGHMNLYDAAKGGIRELVVEKPGVKFLDKGEQGGSDHAPEEFRKEHTLDRWAEAIGAALKASKGIPGIDWKKVLVVGHSEGGLVACKVASDNSRVVTHVATLAGGGVTKLYDLINLARKGLLGQNPGGDPEQSVTFLVTEWKKVLADPNSAEKLFLGHPYRRWTSFLATSPVEELGKYNGKIYIGQGQEDTNVDPSSADALYAQMLARGKNVTIDRVPAANHVFCTKEETKGEGWVKEMKRLSDWFLFGP